MSMDKIALSNSIVSHSDRSKDCYEQLFLLYFEDLKNNNVSE